MVNMAASEVCAAMLLPYKNKLDVSVHLNLLEGRCCARVEDIGMLVDSQGNFKLNWFQILVKSKNKKFRAQIRQEFVSQIERYCRLMEIDEGGMLWLDSHQHVHMIQGVFSVLCELAGSRKYRIETIRLVREPILPFIYSVSLWGTFGLINIIKNLICNIFCFFNYRMIKK